MGSISEPFRYSLEKSKIANFRNIEISFRTFQLIEKKKDSVFDKVCISQIDVADFSQTEYLAFLHKRNGKEFKSFFIVYLKFIESRNRNILEKINFILLRSGLCPR